MSHSSRLPPEQTFNDIADLFLTQDGDGIVAQPELLPVQLPCVDQTLDTNEPVVIKPRDMVPLTINTVSQPRIGPVDQTCLIDRMIVGNLPVHAGLWISQIAAALSRIEGPVVLLRSQPPSTATLDLYPTVQFDEITLDRLTATPPRTLAEAHRTTQSLGWQWLLPMHSIGQAKQLATMPMRRLLFATGADRPARCRVYELIKSAVAADLAPDGKIHIVIVGSDSWSAFQTFERLRRAVRRFLDRSLELVCIVPTIEPARMRSLARFAADSSALPHEYADPPDLFEWIKVSLSQNTAHVDIDTTNARIESEYSEISEQGTLHCSTDDCSLTEDTSQSGDQSEPVIEVRIPAEPDTDITTTSCISEEAASRTASIESTEVIQQDVCVEPTGVEENVTPCVEISIPQTPQLRLHQVFSLTDRVPGLIDIVGRFPDCPMVEIAIDPKGHFHTLAYDDGSSETLAQLLATCDWVREHAQLLNLLKAVPAQSGTELTDVYEDEINEVKVHDVNVIPHIFTSKPKEFAHLRRRHWRIHLLTNEAETFDNNDTRVIEHAPKWFHAEV